MIPRPMNVTKLVQKVMMVRPCKNGKKRTAKRGYSKVSPAEVELVLAELAMPMAMALTTAVINGGRNPARGMAFGRYAHLV